MQGQHRQAFFFDLDVFLQIGSDDSIELIGIAIIFTVEFGWGLTAATMVMVVAYIWVTRVVTDWRNQITDGAEGLDVTFSAPVTDHAASDDCGVAIMGAEDQKFWHDRKGAQLNAIRERLLNLGYWE